ncbi:hypothetical protein [Bacillus taeanensis]|uniref:Uncharacterized protein n=1 Tax=Bacillus taeanensis TaxID=273032 RepID=A0A366XUE9_9BACI|nr:hypothetical protein [Bacillus taeanensis]RBW68775.1 hypothetical protein DS031_14610 [Bacillus taeanensis]
MDKQQRFNEIKQAYEDIELMEISQGKKEKYYEALMDELKSEFDISMMKKAKPNEENKAVLALYRKLLIGRGLDL